MRTAGVYAPLLKGFPRHGGRAQASTGWHKPLARGRARPSPVRRFFRFLAAMVVLIGLLPCGMREALPVVGELVAACCEDEAEGGEHGSDGADCCGSAGCVCAAPAIAPTLLAEVPLPEAFLRAEEPLHVDPPAWRAGPPPTPPPIA
ncbi:hypothetical protein LBMAG42_56960 [Deltaproteobacteria bacterium]|nr:hypothetical protein LBMAG42_56960 [Deltaproteobacteria bacterium]